MEGYEPRTKGYKGYEPKTKGYKGYEPRIKGYKGFEPRNKGYKGYEPGTKGYKGYEPRTKGDVMEGYDNDKMVVKFSTRLEVLLHCCLKLGSDGILILL
jgi:hypothetical protein